MPDVTESLPELIARRQRETGASSVRDLYRRLPITDGVDRISYETFRRLYNGQQRNTRDPRVPRDLALALDVSEHEVRRALGADPNYGEWELPPRIQGLDPQERAVVMSVIDTLLRAKRGGGTDAGQAEAEKIELGRGDYTTAASRGVNPGKRQRKQIEHNQEADQIDPPGPEGGA